MSFTVTGNLRYEYDIKDHLGNTRVSFADTNSDGNADILQEDHYYAFGLRIEGLSSSNKDNKFTYNGKELEDDHGLNWYHYGARYYDPALGRWMAIDPVDQLHSPYSFVKNNPIILIDPNGKEIKISSMVLGIIKSEMDKDKQNGSTSTADAIKMVIAIYGKGGPLQDVDVTVKYNTSTKMLAAGSAEMYEGDAIAKSNTIIDGKHLYRIDNTKVYSMEVVVNPNKLNPNVAKGGSNTISGEVSHLIYNATEILESKYGLDDLMWVREEQDRSLKVDHTNNAKDHYNQFDDLNIIQSKKDQTPLNYNAIPNVEGINNSDFCKQYNITITE